MTDKELLAKLKKDKSSGLALAIDRYAGLLYKVIATIVLPVGTSQDVEECVSDSFMSFYESIDSIDLEKAGIKAYLVVIARRKAIDFYRSNRNKVSLSLDALGENEGRAEDFTLTVERRRVILGALKALGEPDTTIVTRKYLLGETAAQIGEALGMSEASVQKRIERSRSRLKAELGGVF